MAPKKVEADLVVILSGAGAPLGTAPVRCPLATRIRFDYRIHSLRKITSLLFLLQLF